MFPPLTFPRLVDELIDALTLILDETEAASEAPQRKVADAMEAMVRAWPGRPDVTVREDAQLIMAAGYRWGDPEHRSGAPRLWSDVQGLAQEAARMAEVARRRTEPIR